MKGMSVSVRKITLRDEDGKLWGVKWYHPDEPTPPVHVHPYTKKPLIVSEDIMLHGVIVSEPMIYGDGGANVVVELESKTQHRVFETFWVGHLG